MQIVPVKLHSYAQYLEWSEEHRAELKARETEELRLCPTSARVLLVEATALFVIRGRYSNLGSATPASKMIVQFQTSGTTWCVHDAV